MKIIIAALLLAPAAAFASSAFDGTWKLRPDSMKVSGKPDAYVLADGEFTCSSCTPAVKVKADGADHKVSGHDYYDSIAVKVVDANSVETIRKRAGKVVSTSSMSVSADGSTLSGKFTDYNGAKPATGSYSEKRMAAGPAGAHAISGSWQQASLSDANDALTVVTYKMGSDGFNMESNGQRYDAKFDGKEYPIAGDPGHTSVTLKRIDANTVEEIDHRGGKITDEIRLATSKDGKTLAVTDKDIAHGQTLTMTLDKQ
jgi:hypothetical protein